MKVAFGTKQEMTQVFDKDGRVHPATVLKVDPMQVTQVKTQEKDGYEAIQVGIGEQKEHRIAKAQKKLGTFKHLREYHLEPGVEVKLKVGDAIDLSSFEPGDVVEVSGISKGKGFQGVVKRYGFAGGPRTHGQKHSEREPGSIGATDPQRVFKGTRMGGRMGGTRVTVKNLKVLQVDAKNGVLLVSGAVPGRRGTLIEVRGI